MKRDLENIGVGDEQNVASRTSLAQNMYVEYQRQFLAMKSENRMIRGKHQEALAALQTCKQPRSRRSRWLRSSTTIPCTTTCKPASRLLELESNRLHTSAGTAATEGPRITADLEKTSKQLQELETRTRELIRGALRIELQNNVRRLTHQVDISDRELQGFEKQVENKQKEAENVGRISVGIQMERVHVDIIERILKTVAEERERLNVELKFAVARVTVPSGNPYEAAAVPEAEDGFWLRAMKIGFGSVIAMFLPVVGIVIWDLCKAPVNSVGDVSERLKMPFISTVPSIPPAVIGRLGDATRQGQLWKKRFTEAVNSVAARLLRKGEGDQTRVILITSAVGGEGKTTLATQLARGLARAQRRIVLADFDLGQPGLDEAMGLSPEPGICEALRGEGDVMDMVQQPASDRFSVITAGSWNNQELADLSNGAVAKVLEQLRTNFDFVIIDSSPLLPIVDARLVCQHVDAVVLSVFRDISQRSKVQAAHEMLVAFGVRNVEIVLIGG